MQQNKSPLKWRHFEPTVIPSCVRWYCRYQLSYRDVEEMMRERGLYGLTAHVPDIVRRSVECDFLLLAAGPPAFRAVIEQIGFASSFQETHGYCADAVGLATVVLTMGWQERLVSLAHEAENLRAYCLGVHDTCVSKLMAGREKDFAFIKELPDRGLVDLGLSSPVRNGWQTCRRGMPSRRVSKMWRLTSRRHDPLVT